MQTSPPEQLLTRTDNERHQQSDTQGGGAGLEGIHIFNVGSGKDISIAALAGTIKDIVGFEGAIEYDTDKPDGTPRKLLDVSRLTKLGWQPKIDLKKGIASTYEWFLKEQSV